MNETLETTDVKEAALHVILRRLQDIDRDSSTRGAFGTQIVVGQMHMMDKPVFEREIELIQRALGIEPEAKNEEARAEESKPTQPREFQLGDL